VFFFSTLLARALVSIRVAGANGLPETLQALLFNAFFLPWAPPKIASLAWAVANALLWLILMWPFWWKRIRLTV